MVSAGAIAARALSAGPGATHTANAGAVAMHRVSAGPGTAHTVRTACSLTRLVLRARVPRAQPDLETLSWP